jgi:putative ABC transport system permease protein
MIRSAMNLYATPLGVNPAGLLTMRINLPKAKYGNAQSWIAFHQDLEKKVKALPGVKTAGAASQLPMGSWIPLGVESEKVHNDAVEAPEAGGLVVSNNYFNLMQVLPRRGRLFLDSDGQAGPPVAIVNETFAEKFWPGEDALGKRVRVIEEGSAGPWLSVVGVVPDILQNFRELLRHDPLIYLPYAERPESQMFLVARTEVPPATMAGAIRRELQQMDGNLAVYEVLTLQDRIAQRRLTVTLFGGICTVFAAVATILAAIGLYAVIMQSVSQRTQEIGLRVALGASGRDIIALVFAQGIRPLVPGLVIGLMLTLATTRVLRSLLVGVSPNDPLILAGTVLVLLIAAVIGCVVPARRAARVDPMVALRYE